MESPGTGTPGDAKLRAGSGASVHHVVGAHHERYGGYPQGLRGEESLLTARIFAVADALDAMTHDRPYRTARPLVDALDTPSAEAGKQLDPRVVEAALSIPREQWEELLALSKS